MDKILAYISFQRMTPGFETALQEAMSISHEAGRTTELRVYLELMDNWGVNNGLWAAVRQSLVAEFSKCCQVGEKNRHRYIVYFDVWAICCIGTAITNLGEPEYAELDENVLVGAIKETNWSNFLYKWT
jgi:hypothetical protein